MAFTATVLQHIVIGGETVSASKAYSNSGQISVDESIATGQTDVSVSFNLDVSAAKAFYMVSDQDILVETNSGTTPDNSFSLKANVPYVWTSDSYDSFKLTVDVTALFITNTSGSTAAFKVRVIYDTTP